MQGWGRRVYELGFAPDVRILEGPWEKDNVVHARDEQGRDVVLKYWSADRRQNCLAEVRALWHTEGHHLTPRPRLLPGGKRALLDSDGATLTAQELVPGGHWLSREMRPHDFGRHVAELHASLRGAHPETRSRLEAVARWNRSHPHPALRQPVQRALLELDKHWRRLSKLPRADIHGDPTFGNVLVADDGICFVDFEFSRVDVRILDLATMMAAARDDRDGGFIIAEEGFSKAVLEGYSSIAPLSEAERELLPVASLAFFTMVAVDIAEAGGSHTYNLDEVLDSALTGATTTLR